MGNINSIEKFRDADISSLKNSEFLIELEEKDPEFLLNQKFNNFKFFWTANKNPDKINDYKEIEWAPYERDDCLFLEYWYQKYKIGNYTSPHIGDYMIDFHNMIQYNKSEKWRQRRIIRENPDKIQNIYRKSRFDKNFSFSNFKRKETKIDQIEKSTGKELKELGNNKFSVKKYEISSNYEEFEFNIIKSVKNLKIKLQSYYYKRIKNLVLSDFQTFINELKKEINTIAKELGRFNFYNIDYLNTIEEKSFFSSMLRMYTEESFLYKLVNKVLREKDKNLFEKIKLYYISLLASFQYFSMYSIDNLINSQLTGNHIKEKIIEENKLLVYRGSLLTNEEIKIIENSIKKNKPLIRIYNEFISTSLNDKIARKFASNCLIELEIDTKNNHNSYAFLDLNLSVFQNEVEVLLRSGSVIKINKLIIETETTSSPAFYRIFGTVISMDLKEFILFEFKEKSLDFSNNSLGINTVNLLNLAEGIKFNKSIQVLDLSSNYLGSNQLNLRYLAEGLKINHSIEKLNLYNNSLGDDPESFKYLTDALKNNNSIRDLNISVNCLGKNSDNIKNFAEILKFNHFIENLDFSFNSLRGDSDNVIYFVEGLKDNNCIIMLNLSGNCLGYNPNIKLLIDTLKDNTSIQKLWLSNNSLSDDTIKYLEILKKLKGIVI